MFRRNWQSAMIAMARSEPIKRFMQEARATSFLSDQYVAGKTADQGVARPSLPDVRHGRRVAQRSHHRAA